MSKSFKGRIIAPGTVKAEALVSHGGFNTLASYQTALLFGDKNVKCSDQNNGDLYKKPMIGKASVCPRRLALRPAVWSFTRPRSRKQPACMLFSKPIDSLAASGAILAAN
jgi:hypothetical protein